MKMGVRLLRARVKEGGRVFLIIYIIHVGKGGAGRVPGFFQMAPPQLALHRAGGPNKGPWLAPWVRFSC